MNVSKKILIIDDDKFLIDMYSTKIKETGLETEVAFNAEEALEKVRKGFSPDLVLLDIVMPGMSGFEFLETVKKENLLSNAKIIILSNLGQKEDIEKGLKLGAADYIIKAYFTPAEIAKKVQSMLA